MPSIDHRDEFSQSGSHSPALFRTPSQRALRTPAMRRYHVETDRASRGGHTAGTTADVDLVRAPAMLQSLLEHPGCATLSFHQYAYRLLQFLKGFLAISSE